MLWVRNLSSFTRNKRIAHLAVAVHAGLSHSKVMHSTHGHCGLLAVVNTAGY